MSINCLAIRYRRKSNLIRALKPPWNRSIVYVQVNVLFQIIFWWFFASTWIWSDKIWFICHILQSIQIQLLFKIDKNFHEKCENFLMIAIFWQFFVVRQVILKLFIVYNCFKKLSAKQSSFRERRANASKSFKCNCPSYNANARHVIVHFVIHCVCAVSKTMAF